MSDPKSHYSKAFHLVAIFKMPLGHAIASAIYLNGETSTSPTLLVKLTIKCHIWNHQWHLKTTLASILFQHFWIKQKNYFFQVAHAHAHSKRMKSRHHDHFWRMQSCQSKYVTTMSINNLLVTYYNPLNNALANHNFLRENLLSKW